MRAVASLLIVYALLCSARGEDGPLIDGPSSIPCGRLAVFTVSAPDGAKIAWRVITPDESSLLESDVSRTFESNRFLVFASPIAGRYRLLAAVSTPSDLWLVDHALVVDDHHPVPPPEPPSPQPDNEWARFVSEIVKPVPLPFRVVEGRQVAAALRSVANRIASGEIKDARVARETVRQSVRNALGTREAIDRWQPVSNAIDAKLDELNARRPLSLGEYAAIWTAIANAMESMQ